MQISQLVAKELNLSNWKENEAAASINGVTTVEIESDQGHFRVQLVRDSQFLNVKLEEGSKLAAYYNSRFWHEIKTAEKLEIPAADFLTAFQVVDSDVKHSVYLTSFEAGNSKNSLELVDLEEVARHIARLHSVNSQVVSQEFSTAVEENYGNIKAFRKQIQKDIYEVLELAVSNELSRYFTEPTRIMEKVSILIHHNSNISDDEDSSKPVLVVTHGRLTAENCRYKNDGSLAEITEWENVHLGNPAADLTNLIISSTDEITRRKHFMKVFHQYFYTLVDIKPPTYQLSDLKKWFREHHPVAVIEGIERLLLILSESQDEHLKVLSARRWETALNDAVDLITGNYLSDDEQVFFSSK